MTTAGLRGRKRIDAATTRASSISPRTTKDAPSTRGSGTGRQVSRSAASRPPDLDARIRPAGNPDGEHARSHHGAAARVAGRMPHERRAARADVEGRTPVPERGRQPGRERGLLEVEALELVRDAEHDAEGRSRAAMPAGGAGGGTRRSAPARRWREARPRGRSAAQRPARSRAGVTAPADVRRERRAALTAATARVPVGRDGREVEAEPPQPRSVGRCRPKRRCIWVFASVGSRSRQSLTTSQAPIRPTIRTASPAGGRDPAASPRLERRAGRGRARPRGLAARARTPAARAGAGRSGSAARFRGDPPSTGPVGQA